MDYMSRTMMTRGERRVLVLLDEFQNLGKLENALTVATVLGGYGIPCWFFVQSLRSIDNVYTREGRQTLVNSARAQIFLGAQDPEDQRYVSQLLGERKEVTVDKAVSTGVTLFDRKGATMSHRTAMRPLMRPDELGAMNETRCIIKLRNQQPIFGLRNFYYADNELMKRAWLPITPTNEQPRMTRTPDVVVESIEPYPANQVAPSLVAPGAKFALKAPPTHVAASIRVPNGRNLDGSSEEPSKVKPDFRAAVNASARRQSEADEAIGRVLNLFDTTPAKKRAIKKLRKEISGALSDE
ncbi:type IV secretory system conjugative DNA transfer family protein [Rhizobium sp. LjRoot98]